MGTQGHSPISWGRIVIAAVASEVAVMAVLMVLVLGYRFLIAPGHPASDYTAFNDAAGYYVAPPAAGLAALFGALWVCRTASARFVLNGTLVGLMAVLLTGALVFFAKPEDRLMYGVSYILRVIGGWIGGMIAHRSRMRHSTALLDVANQQLQ
jgi:hypothetical protein